ncbi:MAG: hypothetical protein R2865_04280 [Deinococcales bacterium]
MTTFRVNAISYLLSLMLSLSLGAHAQDITLGPQIELWGVIHQIDLERGLIDVQGLKIYLLNSTKIESWQPLAPAQLIKVDGWLDTKVMPYVMYAQGLEL